jgi:hypothetical protein
MQWLKIKGLMACNEYGMVISELELLSSKKAASNTVHKMKLPDSNSISISQPFVLVRDKIKDSVFRPGHNLPTMTMDEFLQLEAQRGNIIGKSEERNILRDPENDFELDLETEKLRKRDERWDWFTKGYGNTYNRS